MLRQCLGQQARRALRPGGAADKSWAAATSALSSSAADGPALCVLDPLLLLEPLRLQARDQERGAGGSKPYVSLEVQRQRAPPPSAPERGSRKPNTEAGKVSKGRKRSIFGALLCRPQLDICVPSQSPLPLIMRSSRR